MNMPRCLLRFAGDVQLFCTNTRGNCSFNHALPLFQLLTNHYERCWKYYCLPNGWANFGVTSEEELHLSRKLFWGIFESLAHKVSEGSAGAPPTAGHAVTDTSSLMPSLEI